MEFYGGLGFIYSAVSFDEEVLPFRLSEDLVLRKAKSWEADNFIEHLITTYGAYAGFLLGTTGYERVKSTGTEPKEFFVVAFNGNNHEIHELQRVSVLITPKILLGDTALFQKDSHQGGKYGHIFGGHSNENFLSECSRNGGGVVSKGELEKLKYFHEELKKAPNLGRSLDMYYSSSKLHAGSSLLTLSLFSIIESLVVHKPTQIENLDSITSQVKNKINLLTKKFDQKPDYLAYFGAENIVKIWGKLYSLRSNIAHGEEYFFSGKNENLKGLGNMNMFLDEVVRELVKLNFSEAELMIDLKAC